MQAFILPSGWTNAMMLAFILPSSWQNITCWHLQQIHSLQKIWLVFWWQLCVHITFLWMLLPQVRVKIVTSPWVAEVFEICGPFTDTFNIFIFLARLMTKKAQHTCQLTCGWITCWNFKAISQCPFWLECLDFTLWFWHGVLMFLLLVLVLVLVLVHHSCSTMSLPQCY